MARGKSITLDVVARTETLKSKAPALTNEEIAKFIGISDTTVGKILNGEYDHLKNGSGVGLIEPIDLEPLQISLDAILSVMEKNNAVLCDIATMIVNKYECMNHVPSKASEAHFRDRIKESRIEQTGEAVHDKVIK